ncbi:conserved hypothetical protein [Vibrio nigripulchritudo MADA3029]|uniref:Uncharacterized protein n=2 Tax=Vibrio nigripulchritudo TaxID=28173 RepID=U4KH65_9VIBR|nr:MULTISPECIES: hypothetical protein [Vibrio]UAB72499.1 hypothetical protein INR79_24910 [Vibrio sp. SCSIO 43132]CCN32814.1 conserved hypothetical protein [Vibrio nigripulchritudo AM115]CCN41257.1 conserved hypothetical protein [Vibrio nigripulchritudo FTn2]CCN48557.1 conserved hypothetical protein [Vibrio nigripulchritudo MADA3020]CCN55575.1 conserved hypothetical protein [Vibrio nigripulchritudo MADA3021]
MPQHQYEQLRSKVLELTPAQLKDLQIEIEGKLDKNNQQVELTEEELDTILRLFRD